MKKSCVFLLLLLKCLASEAQSQMIQDIFKLLPANKIYDLTAATRDSMLEGKTYYPADNDSSEIVAYNYGMSTLVNDYMYVSMSFETSQTGYGMIEIRSFKKLNGDHLVIVSKTGGVPMAYSQHDVSAYIYQKDKKLSSSKKINLPGANAAILLKEGVPDSVKQVILNNSNITYDLHGDQIELCLNSHYIISNESLRKWLKGSCVYFSWFKDQFVINKIDFE